MKRKPWTISKLVAAVNAVTSAILSEGPNNDLADALVILQQELDYMKTVERQQAALRKALGQ